jgi:hypothetical protein
LTWEATADLESGLARFIIERDGEFLANVPQEGKNPYGRLSFKTCNTATLPRNPLFVCTLSMKTLFPARRINTGSLR